MVIRVQLAAASGWTELDFREGMRVIDVFEALKYHPASIALIYLNGTPVDENSPVKDGDEIVLVPLVGGGLR
ncbi:MAG: MoaD/ThiS family protein [Candidatus Hadarchaeum sp.]|uniref:MoaD/ThiS family protein n=1 Tax=Candidatus Hadarchaeum sp. TaxID=2883567 RepID=UPI00316ECB46